MLGTTVGDAEIVLLLLVDELTELDDRSTEGELIEDESLDTGVDAGDVEI